MAVLNVDIHVNDDGSLAIRKVSEEAKKAESSTKNLKNAIDDLNYSNNKISYSFKSLSEEIKNLKKNIDGVVSPLNSVKAIFATLGISILVKESIQAADSFKLMEGRLSLVTKGTIELANAQEELFKISQNTRQSFKDTVDLYTSLARSTQQLGKSQKETLGVTETINKAIIISGASADSAKAALVQLGQGFASGTLRGDELNSVLEQTPRIAEAIAKGMGKTIGELRQLGADGKLTGEAVFEALQKQAQSIDEEFSKMPKTVGQATTQMGNAMIDFVSTIDKATGASSLLAEGISKLSEKAREYSKEIKSSTESVFEQKTIDQITVKANQIASEIEKLKTSMREDDGFLWFGLDERTTSEYQNKLKRLEQQMEQLGETAIKVIEKTNESTQKSSILPATQVKEQVTNALSAYEKYYQAIGDNETLLQIKRYDYAEKYKDLTQSQIDQIINAERNKTNKVEKHNKEWAKRKREITENISIAEQDELAKPYIKLTAKYEEDLIKYKDNSEAKKLLAKEYYTEIERLNKDTIKKLDKKEKEAQEKAKAKNDASIQKELKLQEENFRIQQRQIALLDDEADKQVALATLEYQRTQASLEAQLKKEEITPDYYTKMMEAEDALLAKQKYNWTLIGQVMTNITGDMENAFTDFLDATSDSFMDFGKLATSILEEVYREIIKIAIVKPIVSSIVGGVSSYFGAPATTTASASTASTYSLSSGGTYTNAYFQAYNGGMIPFASGGYTGDGGKYEPKGVVHGGEYVIPAWMVQENKPLISALETTRTRGYAEGGSVGSNVSSGNIRVEIKNESYQSLEVTNATQSYDSEGAVLSIVINGIQKNKMGLRDMLGGK